MPPITSLYPTALPGAARPAFSAKTATIEPTARTFLERFPEGRLIEGGEFHTLEAPTFRLVEE